MTKPLPAAEAPRTRRDGAESRRELLAAARRLFAEHGYHGASVGDIARAAGLRKPSLFHHFESKDVVYAAVLDELLGEITDALAGPAATPGSHLARLHGMNDAIVDFLAARPDAARLLFREALEPVHPSQKKGVSRALSVLALAEAFLVSGMKAGEFAEQDPKQLLLSLAGAHLTYFAIAPLAGPFLGASITSPALVAARRAAVRAQVVRLVAK